MEPELPSKRVGYCRNAARQVITRYAKSKGKVKPPIPIWEITKEQGFEVQLLEGLPDSHSAVVVHDQKLIGVNKNHHHPHRQRFSLGHELGHICLQHPPESELEDQERKICDAEANEFAGEILVPLDFLKGQLKHTNDVDSLAQTFDVSRDVVVLRLSAQGLLGRL